MNIIKQILVYTIWIVVSLILGIAYGRILLGPSLEDTTVIAYLLSVFYYHGLLYLGIIIGSLTAIIFILLDTIYLKKKLKNSMKSIGIRFVILFGITGFIVIIHYILEKVFDVI